MVCRALKWSRLVWVVKLSTLKGNISMNITAAKRLVIAVVAAGALTGATGCGLLEKPTAHITGASLQDLGMTAATMLFDVEVSNPYTVPLPMSNVDYVLSSQGQQFLTGKADVQGSVLAGASKTLGVPVRISFPQLLDAVKGARPGDTIPYRADLGLSVDVPALGPLRVPMSRDGELSIPTTTDLLGRLKDLAK